MTPENPAFRDAIFSALCACLNLSPASAEAASLIVPAYEEPEPAPRLARNADVIFYSILPEDDPSARYQTVTPSEASAASHIPLVSSFLAYKLLLICYGPHASDYAHKIRAFLYLDGSNAPRAILRKAGIYPVPRPPQPLLLHEPEGSLWRARADLTISLRVRDEQKPPLRRGAISSPPAVVIRR